MNCDDDVIHLLMLEHKHPEIDTNIPTFGSGELSHDDTITERTFPQQFSTVY
jgi:hypothetical protein